MRLCKFSSAFAMDRGAAKQSMRGGSWSRGGLEVAVAFDGHGLHPELVDLLFQARGDDRVHIAGSAGR